jgi:GNAT superfamily N-acetyltransferase
MGYLDGQPIGCISVVRYSGTFGFLGFYIVRPDRRGQGFGYRLWQAGMAHLPHLLSSRGADEPPRSALEVSVPVQ